VNIGIGGSDLGPRMATQALMAFRHPELRVHYVANLDGADLATTLAALQPRTTLFVIASKTFTTQETMQNAASARAWLVGAGRGGGGAAFRRRVDQPRRSRALRHRPGQCLRLLGLGRRPLLAVVGDRPAAGAGRRLRQLRKAAGRGARHGRAFLLRAAAENLPGLLALLEIWNSNFLGADNRALLPYSQSLGLLPRYLQQLEMESNGKPVDRQGSRSTAVWAPSSGARPAPTASTPSTS
jgi:glucose-6-phosphate isomerase